uniref:Uncharacterized protein n=1 Tax=Caenorhabditis tropicalis TaxID=1561998 RepID=A0A1I7UQA0_9PELO
MSVYVLNLADAEGNMVKGMQHLPMDRLVESIMLHLSIVLISWRSSIQTNTMSSGKETKKDEEKDEKTLFFNSIDKSNE